MDPTTIIQRLSNFTSEQLKDDKAARNEAIGLSRILTSALQDPIAQATEIMVTPLATVAARIGVDLDLFRNVASSDQPVEVAILAQKANADVELVYRIARFLGSLGYLNEVSPGAFASTPLTHAMSNEAISAGHRFIFDCNIVASIKAPQYLRETNFQLPVHHTDGIVQYAHNTKLPVFEYISRSPHLLDNFNLFMGATMAGNKYWTDWYPIADRIIEGANTDTKLLVDIGGGKGHDLQLFLDQFPDSKGLVLQELPQALQAASADVLDPSVERVEYDFFTEQPIKGARAYFMHHIIHDWPKPQALDILKNIHAAMTPGYSKLLIHDLILPDSRPNAMQCMYDMTMLSFNGGKERSRSQWKELLKNAGFDVIKLWVDAENADGIVEVERS